MDTQLGALSELLLGSLAPLLNKCLLFERAEPAINQQCPLASRLHIIGSRRRERTLARRQKASVLPPLYVGHGTSSIRSSPVNQGQGQPPPQPSAVEGAGKNCDNKHSESQALPPAFDLYPPSSLMTWDRNYRHFTDGETEAWMSKCAEETG